MAGCSSGIAESNIWTLAFLPTLENYLTLLYQKGGSLYLNNGQKSGLTTEMAMEAFDEFTMLYDSYNIPVTYDFLNRFRSGEMPLAVADFTVYNQLSVFAPAIKDLWAMTVLPGTYDEDGALNTTGIATSMGCVMMADSDNKTSGMDFYRNGGLMRRHNMNSGVDWKIRLEMPHDIQQPI